MAGDRVAAFLTVAFEIRKAICLYKNDPKTDDEIVQEVKTIYERFTIITDSSVYPSDRSGTRVG